MGEDWKFSPDTVIDEITGIPETNTTTNFSAKEPLDERQALDNTEVLINLRETVQSFGLSYFCDGTLQNASQYDYTKSEKERLVKAWSRVIGQYRVNVSPWVDVVATEAVCTGPLVMLAVNNRKQRILLLEQKAEIERLKKENAQFSENVSYSQKQERKDTKTQWKIDENGYFEYSLANTYITKGNRTEKPQLTPENYELLTKHNGKETVDKAFA